MHSVKLFLLGYKDTKFCDLYSARFHRGRGEVVERQDLSTKDLYHPTILKPKNTNFIG